MSRSSPYIVGRIPKLSPKWALFVMPLLMSFMMSAVVTLTNTVRILGWTPEMWDAWPSNWLLGWSIAFPVVMVVMPLVKRMTTYLVRTG